MSSDGELTWRRAAERVLKGADFDNVLRHQTVDGLIIEPLYPRRQGMAPIAGRSPGTRWQILQRVEHPDPVAANALALAELQGGAGGLTLVMADSPFARGFGLAGAALATILDGVHFNMVTLRLEAGEATPTLALGLGELANRHGEAAPDLHFGFDPLSLLASQGSLGTALANPRRSIVDLARHLGETGHSGPAVAADSRVFHEAGATPVQDLAILVANGVFYLKALEAAGLPLKAARSRIEFVLAADADVFMTLARCRALRLLWAQVEDACGLVPAPLQLHVETSWRMLTRRNVWTNLLRATGGVFAAALGGADSISVLPVSCAHGLPDAFARRSARNAQHVLQEEANLYRIGDPAAGAGGFEALTDMLCLKAWALFREIERRGGALACLTSGWLQGQIAGNPQPDPILVGTTKFVSAETEAPPVFDLAPRPWRRHGPAGLTAPALKRTRLAQAYEAMP
jgi:methylmalonyl-CoA mutase